MPDLAQFARIEAKLDSVMEKLETFVDTQGEHNTKFYEVRDIVLEIKANARGAWFTIGLFGTLTVALSTMVAWVISVARH